MSTKAEPGSPELIVAMGQLAIDAYIIGLSKLWSDETLTAKERRELPTLLRREILLEKGSTNAAVVAEHAMNRARQDLFNLRAVA